MLPFLRNPISPPGSWKSSVSKQRARGCAVPARQDSRQGIQQPGPREGTELAPCFQHRRRMGSSSSAGEAPVSSDAKSRPAGPLLSHHQGHLPVMRRFPEAAPVGTRCCRAGLIKCFSREGGLLPSAPRQSRRVFFPASAFSFFPF